MTKAVDVARRAGVSPATVSRVLNGNETVSLEVRERVFLAVRSLDYRPNAMARGLRRGLGVSVALLVGDIEQAHFVGLTRYIQSAVEEAGFDLLLYNLGHSAQRLSGFVDRAPSMSLRALVIASSDGLARDLSAKVQALNASGCRVISVGQDLSRLGIASVVHEERAATLLSVKHLIAQGRRRIGYAGRLAGSAVGTERFRGYKAALSQAGLLYDPDLVFDFSYRFTAGRNAIARALGSGVRIDALQAGSDEIAVGAIAALQDAGLSVPSDIAVMGFGNIDLATHIRPALTTLSSHPDIAAAHVQQLLGAGNLRKKDLLSVISRSLILRQSS
jgi:DNA-binding LacI/PurR family transcriptional regulator